MLNKVILIGNVGRAPEVRVLETGSKMARFTLATNENYFSADGQKIQHTEWHNIVLWRAEADYAEKYISVGSEIYIEGRIRSRQATDPRTKISQTVYEIVAHTVRLTTPVEVKTPPNETVETAPEPFADPDGLPF